MILLVVFFLVILFLFVTNYNSLKETKKLATDDNLDKQTESLPSNEEICTDMQKELGSNCEIQLDDEARSSAYIFFQNKIILSNTESSKKDYTRVLFIAHECVHAVQNKFQHKINFVLANIKNLYDIILFILLVLGKGSLELILISFLISFLSFYYRIMLETDAVYRSIIVSRKYLKKKNMETIADRYEEIIPKTISGMYFSYISPIIIKIAVFVMISIIV